MSELVKRVLVGGLCILVMLGVLPFAFSPIVAALILLIFIVLGCLALEEFLRLCAKKGLSPPRKTLMLGVALFLVASFLQTYFTGLQQLPAFTLALFIFLIFLLHFRKPQQSLTHIATSTFGILYTAVPLGLMIQILYQPYTVQDGRAWLLYLILVTKIADIMAYFVGKNFGKTPLSPTLSPKKTVEGFVAGTLFSLVLSLVFFFLVQEELYPIHLTLFEALFLGIALPVFGGLGDLSESLMKRDAKAKESGKIPGLGGVLDLIDSLIFTAPVLYFYLRFVNAF